MNFSADDYELGLESNNYWKIKDMQQGDNRFRIVQKPLAGWILWKDGKPLRYRPENRPNDKEAKAFTTAYVWDYARDDLFVLEITQVTIRRTLANLAKDPEWGDPVQYDLKLNKKGSGQDVKYMLTALPPKPLADNIKKAVKDRPVNLQALFYGGDPWTDINAPESNKIASDGWEVASEQKIDSRAKEWPSERMSSLDTLKEHLLIDEIPADRLDEWLKLRAQTKGSTIEEVVNSCLDKQVLPVFKRAFFKWTQENVAVV